MLPRGLIRAWWDGLSSPCFFLFFPQLNSSTGPRLVSTPTPSSRSISLSLFFLISSSLTCSLSHISLVFSLSPPDANMSFCSFHLFFFFSQTHSGLTLQWLLWCLQTSTYSCLLGFHPIIFMAWESTCIDSIAMTQTGKRGPSSPEMLFPMGWVHTHAG